MGSLDASYEPYSGGVIIRVTNQATGRITDFDNASASQDLSFDSEDFQPVQGHVYRIEVTPEEGGGNLLFHVYEWDTVTMARDLTTASYDSATVRFVRSHDALGAVNEYSQQWITL